MEISIEPRKDGEPVRVVRREKFSTTSKSLVKFFNDRPRKDLIVIVYEKNVLDEAETNLVSIRLRDYFVARGYKKIIIRQANNGGPPNPLLEYPKRKTAEQAVPSDGHKPTSHASTTDPTAPADAH